MITGIHSAIGAVRGSRHVSARLSCTVIILIGYIRRGTEIRVKRTVWIIHGAGTGHRLSLRIYRYSITLEYFGGAVRIYLTALQGCFIFFFLFTSHLGRIKATLNRQSWRWCLEEKEVASPFGGGGFSEGF